MLTVTESQMSFVFFLFSDNYQNGIMQALVLFLRSHEMSVKSPRMFITAVIISVFAFLGSALLSAAETDAYRGVKTHLQTLLSDPNVIDYLPGEITLDCINGSKLQLDSGKKTLFVLLWNTKVSNAAEFKAFGSLFFDAFDNPKVRFLAINLDDVSKKKKIVAELLKSSCPWAQVIAAEPGNKALKVFTSVDIRKATLVIIAPMGQVEYVGSAGGSEPQEILSRFSTVAKRTEKTDKMVLYRKKPIEVSEEEFNPRAEKLLENAKMFFRIGSRMIASKSYGQPIRMCRMVIKDYPNTKYADKARLLMRQVPQRYRKRYRITDEELGL